MIQRMRILMTTQILTLKTTTLDLPQLSLLETVQEVMCIEISYGKVLRGHRQHKLTLIAKRSTTGTAAAVPSLFLKRVQAIQKERYLC